MPSHEIRCQKDGLSCTLGSKGKGVGGAAGVLCWFSPAAVAGCKVSGVRGAGEEGTAAGTRVLKLQVLVPHADPAAWVWVTTAVTAQREGLLHQW